MTVAIASDGLAPDLRPRDMVGALAGSTSDQDPSAFGRRGAAGSGTTGWSIAPGSPSSAGASASSVPTVPVLGETTAVTGLVAAVDGAGDEAPAGEVIVAGGDTTPAGALDSPDPTDVTTAQLPVTPVPVVDLPASPPAAAEARPPVCQVEPLSAAAGLDSFYTQVCWAAGIPVVSSGEVDGRALQAAAEIVVNMLAPRPDLHERLVTGRLRVGIIGQRQRAVELPEYRDLPTNFPDTDWDAARAYGATPRRPLLAVPEENLLCSPADTYPGQSVLTHELGHTVLDMAVAIVDTTFKNRVAAAFKQARTMPVYADTYALVNPDEYWAEGVQDFFDASRAGYGPGGGGDGYDGPIASRDALRANDPVLYGLIASVFTETSWRPSCPR